MTESIIEGITNYFMNCPLLKDGVFRVDALSDAPIEYVIETGVFDPVRATYVNGDTERIYNFSFGSREYYTMDRFQPLENSAFYEHLAGWVEQQNRDGNFPDLPEGCTPWNLFPLSSGYLFDSETQTARYQIQMQLVYYKEVMPA